MPPAVAFAYGSFGDIIATAQLVIKIVEVLRRSGRPSSACTELEKDLKALHSDLMHISLQTAPLDPFLTTRINEEVAQCHSIMYEFHSKTAASRGWVQTILWANSEDKELAAFSRQVIQRRAALSVVVGLKNSAALNVVQDRVTDVGMQVGRGNDRIRLVQDGVNAVQNHVLDVGAQVGRGNDQIRAVHEGISGMNEQLGYQEQKIERVQVSGLEEKLGKWLRYPPDMAEKQHETQKLHHEGTGSWFLDSRQFIEWLDNLGSLWIQGQSGAGKTVLSSTVIRKLCSDHQCFSKGTAVAYFYFDFRDQNKQLTEIMLRSIILQLSAQSPHPYSALDRQYQLLKGQTLPTYKKLLDVLDKLLLELHRTYIVLDALDECKDNNLLIALIRNLRDRTNSPLHLLLTSQTRKIFTEALDDLPHISLDLQTTQSDIRLFVSHELRFNRSLTHVIHRAEEITTKVVERSNGMFRLAACLLYEISRSTLNPDLDTILATLPGDLFGAYSRFLNSIDQADFVYVAVILRWLVWSAQPVTLLELEDALAFDFSNPQRYVFNPDKRGRYAAGVCRLLEGLVSVRVDILDSTALRNPVTENLHAVVSLAHASVADYILSAHFTNEHKHDLDMGGSHTFIAQTCVYYLLHFVDHPLPCANGTFNFPLTLYAANYWDYHLCRSDNRALLLPSAINLLENGSNLALPYLGWGIGPLMMCSRIGYIEGMRFLLEKGADVNEDAGNPLMYASRLGHIDIVCCLLEHSADVNVIGGSALVRACERGHIDIVHLLVENGADVNADDGSALYGASLLGHVDIVQLLLENGADINTNCGSALFGAFREGHIDIVRVLLANPNLDAENTLIEAARRGQTDSVRFLLENGADINSNDDLALFEASSEGHIDIVCLLLENGTDINAKDGSALCEATENGQLDIVHLLLANPDLDKGKALAGASSRGQTDSVRLLLENGADINADDGSALYGASSEGHIDIVCLLLENGADINAKDGSALCEATENGQLDIVHLLLANPDLDKGKALGEASWRGQTDIVRLLLKKGADASCYGHIDIVRLLLENGADVNSDDGWPLYVASRNGRIEIVHLLFENGADVNANDGLALYGASSEGHINIVCLLLENGADVNSYDGLPLYVASCNGHMNIVHLLLENGANVSSNDGLALFFEASREGHIDIVHLLLANPNLDKGKALVRASCRGQTDSVRLLLENGADANAHRCEALRSASRRGHTDIVELLRANGARDTEGELEDLDLDIFFEECA
ncbi:ankyrin repeat-containing domain protein [Mycena epipterygia]|nr:ankyrin repeat-containing domain protein [Mycena epipterygia]